MATIHSNQVVLPNEAADLTAELMQKRKGQLRLIGERFLRNRVSVAGLVVLLIIALAAIFAPIITHQTASFDPATKTNVFNTLAPPSGAHLLGTDDVGRDEFAHLVFGGRVSLVVGVFTMAVAITVGVTIGMLAGFFGGWVDNLLMRITDAILSVPFLLILIVLSAGFSDGTVKSTVLIIGLIYWPVIARVVRGEFLALKEREFLLAARTLGAGNLRLMLRHILPNAAGPIIVAATLAVGDAILTESTLSFFGFGIQPPTATWGTMLQDSQSYITSDSLLTLLPGLAILFTVLCFNLMGDGLRDALDPYMTQR
jgi:peptide/nickel transport system permease protein